MNAEVKKTERSNNTHKAFRRKLSKSRILFEITALIAVVFTISWIVAGLTFRGSQSSLIQKSKEKLIESEATLICSSHAYISSLLIQLQLLKNPNVEIESINSELSRGLAEETTTPVQELGSDLLAGMIDSGLFGSKLAVFVLPPNTPDLEEPTVVMASNDDYVHRNIPSELENLVEMPKSENKPFRSRVDADNSYELMLKGVPGMGLKGEYLVTTFKFPPESSMGEIWYFDFTPMHEELSSIDRFYKAERKNINLILVLVDGSAIIVLILISFIVLRYLIRKKITKPIDELAVVAERVMEGDLDVEVPVGKGEEFEKLKITFNEMLAGLRNILHKSTGSGPGEIHPNEDDSGDKKNKNREAIARPRGRSSILLQMTISISLVFIASGFLSSGFFFNSQSRLLERSKEKLIQSEARLISTGHNFLANTIVEILALQGVTGDVNKEQLVFFQAITNKTLCPAQAYSNILLEDMIKNGLLGMEAAVVVLPAIPPTIPESLVVMSSDEKYMYMKVSDELVKLAKLPRGTDEPYEKRINARNSYVVVEKGVPEMGIRGKQLVSSYLFIPDPEAKPMWLFDFKPMDKEVNSLNGYYNSEKRKANVLLGCVNAGCLFLLLVVTFLVLSFLIRTRITRPIDELAAVAEHVMDGDLDVEVPVRKGEEFEGLKRAFNEMLISLREIIAKSTGE